MATRLRSIEESDLPQLRNWRNNDQLRHCFREHRLLNMTNQYDWWNRISRSDNTEMFGIEVDGILVGVCGLCNINWVNRTAEVSRYIAPDYQDRELMLGVLELLQQKAFDEFNLSRLWGEVYNFCTEKIASLEQCGYTHEGTMRKHVFKQGKSHDSLIYGLLRKDYSDT